MASNEETNFLPHNYNGTLEYAAIVGCLRKPTWMARDEHGIDEPTARRIGFRYDTYENRLLTAFGASQILNYHKRIKITEGKFKPEFSVEIDKYMQDVKEKKGLKIKKQILEMEFEQKVCKRMMEKGFGEREQFEMKAWRNKENEKEGRKVVVDEVDAMSRPSTVGGEVYKSIFGNTESELDEDGDSNMADSISNSDCSEYAESNESSDTIITDQSIDTTTTDISSDTSIIENCSIHDNKQIAALLAPSTFNWADDVEVAESLTTKNKNHLDEMKKKYFLHQAAIEKQIRAELEIETAEAKAVAEKDASEKYADEKRLDDEEFRLEVIDNLASLWNMSKIDNAQISTDNSNPGWKCDAYSVFLTPNVQAALGLHCGEIARYGDIAERLGVVRLQNQAIEMERKQKIEAYNKRPGKDYVRKMWMRYGDTARQMEEMRKNGQEKEKAFVPRHAPDNKGWTTFPERETPQMALQYRGVIGWLKDQCNTWGLQRECGGTEQGAEERGRSSRWDEWVKTNSDTSNW